MNQVFKAEIKDILALMGKSIQQGMSVEKLLTELNLPSDLLADNSGLINFSDCWRIVIANQNTIQDETHLMSSRPLKKGTTRLIFSNLHDFCVCEGFGTIRHCNTRPESSVNVTLDVTLNSGCYKMIEYYNYQ